MIQQTQVIKSYLRDLALNDVYSGGLSSYCLVVLLFSFMRECESFGYPTNDCGYLLVGFFSNFLFRFESNLTHVDDPLAPSYYTEDGAHVRGKSKTALVACRPHRRRRRTPSLEAALRRPPGGWSPRVASRGWAQHCVRLSDAGAGREYHA